MPKITTYQAQGKAGVLALPANAPVEDLSGLYRAGRQVGQLGDTMADVAAKLKDQQRSIDASAMIGDYEGRIRGLQFKIDQETTDPEERMSRFHEEATALQKEISGRSKDAQVVGAFASHVNRNYPVQRHSYNAHTLEYQLKKQVSDLRDEGERYSRLAAEAPNPEERDKYIKLYENMLNRAEAGGLLDPAVMQQWRNQWKEQSQLDYMDILRMRDPDKLFELEEKGAFLGMDSRKREAIMDRATRERAEKATRGQAELRRAVEIWRESIYRETEKRLADRTLTMEWIEEYGYAMDDTKLKAYRQAYRDQQLGVGAGESDVEREMVRHVYNPNLDPRRTLATLDALYVNRKVGYEKYTPWVQHLNSEIARRDNERRSDQDKGEVRIRELRGRRAEGYLNLAQSAFRVSGMLDFDASAGEALTQFQQEYLRRVDHYGGNEDGAAVFADLMPRLIVQVDARMETRKTFLLSELGKYLTRDALKKDRTILGEAEYARKVGYLAEYHGIQQNVKRLQDIRLEAEGKRKK